METDLKQRVATSVFAFRGYNQTNLGRTAELLAHPSYGPIFEAQLNTASAVLREATGRGSNLVRRVERGEPTELSTFAEDIGVILAASLAQVEALTTIWGVDYTKARFAFGYSLGEIAALVCSGVFSLRDVYLPLAAMADDSASLGRGVTMGIVFSRDTELDLGAVTRLCVQITQEGRGAIAISAILSPNTVLVLGQQDTVDRFKERFRDVLGDRVHLRKHSGAWPPLHTPLLWDLNIPCRAGVLMRRMGGGLTAPVPPVLSLVTGKFEYNDYNAREYLHRWIDEPQRLWDAVYTVLAEGVDTVIHVGPEPTLIPATFRRLSDNVKAQLAGGWLNTLGLRAVQNIWRPWLARWLSSKSALLRAPFIEHVILEDWLLEHEPATIKQPQVEAQPPAAKN